MLRNRASVLYCADAICPQTLVYSQDILCYFMYHLEKKIMRKTHKIIEIIASCAHVEGFS